MKTRELRNLGVPKGAAVRLAQQACADAAAEGMDHKTLRAVVRRVAENPEAYRDEEIWGELAGELLRLADARASFVERDAPAPWRTWGEDLDPKSIEQMKAACRLPVAVRGALMPDAHLGYGLPIGGVLAVEGAVIPYAVGVDIACRMKLSVLDLPVNALKGQRDRLASALTRETEFGVGAAFRRGERREHPVMDADWTVSPVTARGREKAWEQLGTSGSGNHFAEFGILTLEADDLGLQAGQYLALLSHSGSRGTGSDVAEHYSKLAMERHPELPGDLKHLAWLELDSDLGREYWAAMELMGRYASANHELIHRHVARNVGAAVLAEVENHHNFAWKEQHDGRDVVVHRKGATPAAAGDVGIIPGSMGTSGYVVRGRGCETSLNSAAHGAGRKMSRSQAKRQFTWSEARRLLAERGVELISAGLDEVPMAYKDIEEVMAAQQDLVDRIARFDPKLVKMAS
jgi:tRNA-splicing ligase RtcB